MFTYVKGDSRTITHPHERDPYTIIHHQPILCIYALVCTYIVSIYTHTMCISTWMYLYRSNEYVHSCVNILYVCIHIRGMYTHTSGIHNIVSIYTYTSGIHSTYAHTSGIHSVAYTGLHTGHTPCGMRSGAYTVWHT